MTDNAIILANLRVEASGRSILGPIDLAIQRGQCLAVLGPSGSGKTTLLKSIAGIQATSGGTIALFGKLATEGNKRLVKARARECAMVFQEPALWPHMSVEQHLRFAKSLRPGGSFSIDDFLRWTRLDPLRKQKPSTLSGGEKQRLGLAVAFIGQPKIVLLDEPFSSLDVELKREMLELTFKLNQYRATIIYVTHDPYEALKIADKVLLLRDGQVAWQGAPSSFIAGSDHALSGLQSALSWLHTNDYPLDAR